MSTPHQTPDEIAALLDEQARPYENYGQLVVRVPAARWIDALTRARDTLGCTFFDWLSAVDETDHTAQDPQDNTASATDAAYCTDTVGEDAAGAATEPSGFTVLAHVAAVHAVDTGRWHLLIETRVPYGHARLPTATGVWAGAAWHERETHEMFGITFAGHPFMEPLLLPDGFEGHPLRKDFVLAARVVKDWPGAKEPGESEHASGKRRRAMRPLGVPDPSVWGPRAHRTPEAGEGEHA